MLNLIKSNKKLLESDGYILQYWITHYNVIPTDGFVEYFYTKNYE